MRDKGSISKRKYSIKEAKIKIYIYCEGAKTEPIYFRSLKNKYRLGELDIIVSNTKETDPMRIVNAAKKDIDNSKKGISEYDIDLKHGDQVWCVFDMDDRSNDVLIKAKTIADKNNINVVLSNRCFEIWYLLHFAYTTTEFTSTEQIIKVLEQYIPNYAKNKNVFDKLEQQPDNRKNAIERAKKLVRYHETTRGISVYSKESNPSTDVYKLIEIIEKYI